MMQKIPRPVGQAMHAVRAGVDKVLFHQKEAATVPATLDLRSTFPPDSPLPANCTSDGEGHSPALTWTGVPKGTSALVLLVEDADSPTLHPIVHALVSDLPPTDGEIDEGALGGAYRPPDPPAGHGPHRYFFQLYSLRERTGSQLKDRADLVKELKEGNCGGRGYLMGTYERT
jgi:phosphatidylethanolamine-binding protein (PEBP) family uncharacterized protein